ncbi:Zinc finger protein 185 [Dissostichus eleginoides]|uniref:Zinc finger protein 185 n=1 Tax=Dissostichus eleginoides TaxID=100907 RepID=A0AAD9BI29_DISEL|nr:Zinc finger protein 185 [Dissostichus eleginoides]
MYRCSDQIYSLHHNAYMTAVDSPPSTTLQTAPSEGDSANHANGEVIPQKDAQPEGSTVGPTDDAKTQAPTEELNVEAQVETSVANTNAENKEENAAENKANVEPIDVVAELHFAERIQNDEALTVSSTQEIPEAVSVVKTAEQSVAEIKEDQSDATIEQPKIEAEDVENEALAEAAVKSPTDGPAVTDAAGEESPIQVSVETVPDLVSAQSAAEMATEGSCDKGSQEPAAVEVVEVVAEPAVESSPETPAVTDAAGEESVTQVSVKTVPDLVAESVSEVPAQSAAETEQAAVEVVETVTEVEVEVVETVTEVSPSDTSDVVNATPGDVAAVQDIVEAVAEVAVESSPESPAVTIVAGTEAPLQVSVEQVPDLVAESVSDVPVQPAAETATEGGCEKASQEQAAVEVVDVVVEVVEKSLSDTTAETEAPLQVSVEQVPDVVADTVSESPTKAETAVKSVECEVKSAPSAETVLETKAEQVAEVQTVDNTVVEQIVEPTPEKAADLVTELNIEDALLEPVPALEDVQDKSSDSPIEQSKALDVEPPKTEAAPEPQDDPKPADQNQNSYEANRNTNVCSYCDKFIDGNVKFFLNEPVMTCHPDCLKCGVCAIALGDLLTAIFLHGQVIHCGGCFHKTLVI